MPAMDEKKSAKLCNSDRNQRRHCVHYHEKTGRCTLNAKEDTRQEQLAEKKPVS